MDGLLAWRKVSPIVSHTTYMISHSLGAMPKRTEQALQEFAETWASRGVRAWEEGWWRNNSVTDGLNFPSNDYIYHGLKTFGRGGDPL